MVATETVAVEPVMRGVEGADAYSLPLPLLLLVVVVVVVVLL